MKKILNLLLICLIFTSFSFVMRQNNDYLKSKSASLPQIHYPYNYLGIADVTLNQHKLLLDSAAFYTNYGSVDSSITTYWDCGSPLEWLDADWMEQNFGKMDNETGTFEKFDGMITSLFVNKTTFTTNRHAYLFQKTEMKGMKFRVISAGIELTDKITVAEFKKHFSKAVEEPMEQSNEIRFRISIEEGSDDAFLFDFKNGTLFSIELWWLLC